MDRELANMKPITPVLHGGVSFAAIGHLESWEKLYAVVQALRRPSLAPISDEDVRSIIPHLPPRTVVRISIHSTARAQPASGVYIDTFITPDRLTPAYFRANVDRVRKAALCAAREGARITALGGFTSILLEGNLELLPRNGGTVFTTGNTLTVAYIVKAVESACRLHRLDLSNCRLLVIGATGDVGSGCVYHFGGKVRQILLCARNAKRLACLQADMNARGVMSRATTDSAELLGEADVIILAASVTLPTFSLDQCQSHAVICDAGYPKNTLAPSHARASERFFYGGMGMVEAGYTFVPDVRKAFYDFPMPGIGHACMLEAALLALEGRFESFSKGRGLISKECTDDIWRLSQKHGFAVAPFFNHEGLWSQQSAAMPEVAN